MDETKDTRPFEERLKELTDVINGACTRLGIELTPTITTKDLFAVHTDNEVEKEK